ncbi:MAG: Rab family GTPase [Candidatus Kariarchaeaceae archaeon]|jgi:small GTP-binding protein
MKDEQNNKSNIKPITVKFIICGDPSVGKTTLLNYFSHKKTSSHTLREIAAEFRFKKIEIEGNKLALQIWKPIDDINLVRQVFFMGASGAILMFDVTRPDTLRSIEDWMDLYVKNHQVGDNKTKANLLFVILANKSDLLRKVKLQEVEQLIQDAIKRYNLLESQFSFYWTSMLTGENLELMSSQLTSKIFEQIA